MPTMPAMPGTTALRPGDEAADEGGPAAVARRKNTSPLLDERKVVP